LLLLLLGVRFVVEGVKASEGSEIAIGGVNVFDKTITS
jgi:hypothetical protein